MVNATIDMGKTEVLIYTFAVSVPVPICHTVYLKNEL